MKGYIVLNEKDCNSEICRSYRKKGVNVQKGQDVIVNASVEQPEFVRMVVDECYKAGARRVKVEWSYQPITKSTYRYAKAAALAKVEEWEKAKFEHMAETLPAMIHIISDDPGRTQGNQPEKGQRSKSEEISNHEAHTG